MRNMFSEGSRAVVPALVALVVVTGCAGEAGSSPVAPSLPSTTSAAPSAPVPTVEALGAFRFALPAGVEVTPDIAYTDVTDCGGTPCVVPGDVLAPEDASDLPTIVLLPGGGTQLADRRVHQGRLAADLASRGAVVFLMAYRSAATGNYDSAGSNDVRCAVRYARFAAAEHGGDPDRVVVVGHSQGGFHALEVALAPDEEADACIADGSGVPDAVVGLGAPLPRTGASAEESAPPIWLFAGDEDGDAEGDAARLQERGFDASARELPGVTHAEITDSAATPEIVDLIFEAIDSLQRQ